jgi:2-succinyl-5-enolpyruvyl-6-hydroxy-3-cyclohexene-1-carboxylate synthase
MSDVPFQRPLVLISGLAERHRPSVRDFAVALNAPVYAEATSGLREDAHLASLQITAGERMLHRGKFDGVIRIGNVPTVRFWRDLDETRSDLPVMSFSAIPFAGLSRGELRSIDDLPRDVSSRDLDEDFLAADRERFRRISDILDGEPLSELSMVRRFSNEIQQDGRLFLGNSLPIREWDLVASREPRGVEVDANRGANGIDGQLSTFFGWCKPGPNYALVGDLTALYDLNAPWIVPQLDMAIGFRIFIINNGGGRIFSRVPSLRGIDGGVRERIIENSHSLRFTQWAEMFSIEDSVIELLPDDGASRRVWNRYDELWS